MNEAARLKICLPRWTATTRRVVKLAVAAAVHVEDDRHGRVARPDEVAVQRVADAVLDRLVGGQQRLGDHLAAEDAAGPPVRRGAPEQVLLDPLELQGLDQGFGLAVGVGDFTHGRAHTRS